MAKSTKKEVEVEVPIVPKKKNYLNNKDMMIEVIKSKEQKQMNDKLALMLTMLCKRYAKKGNFANYSYNDDMQGYAMLMLVKTWNSFDPQKSNNPFAFFTQCIKNSFIQYLNHEKRQSSVKNKTLIAAGMNPSHSYMTEYENAQSEQRDHNMGGHNTFDHLTNTDTDPDVEVDKENEMIDI